MSAHASTAFSAPSTDHPAIAELAGRPQWVGWKYQRRFGGKPTKPPVSPRTGQGASHSHPSDWSTFDRAIDFARSQGMAGVGFVLADDDDLTGGDLDNCRDPATGEIDAWAKEVLALAETYAEVSPSGTGIRLIWRGKVSKTIKRDVAQVEIYGRQRYLTITGDHIAGTPTEIRPAPKTLAALTARVASFDRPAEPSGAAKNRLRENEDGTATDLETGEDFDSLQEAEKALAAERNAGRASEARPADLQGETGLDEIVELLSYVDPDLGYPEWLEVLIAIHALTGGSSAGQSVADQWSAKGRKYKAGDVSRRWSRFRGGAVGGGTLAVHARRGGADLSSIRIKHMPKDEGTGTAEHGAEVAERLRANWSSKHQTENDPSSEKEDTTDFLHLVNAASLAGRPRPKREFLDAGRLLPMKNVTLLSGDGGTGKSLLAMQLAVAVSVTGMWLGRETRRGGVLYFSAEDDEDETHLRLLEIGDADGFSIADAGALNISVMAGHDAVLGNEEKTGSVKWTKLFRRLREKVIETKPTLLVLDNLADVFAGNENAKTLARQFVGGLRRIAIETPCAVLLLSHPSLSGMSSGTGTSGNTAWSNSVRSRLYLYRQIEEGIEINPNRRLLETKKANYGPTGAALALEWQAGRFLSLDTPTSTSDPFAGAAKILKAERVFMDLLRWHLRKDKFVSPNKSVSYAPAVFAKHPQSEGVKSREFEVAMTTLMDRDEITIFTHGKGQSRRQHLGLPIGAELYEDV